MGFFLCVVVRNWKVCVSVKGFSDSTSPLVATKKKKNTTEAAKPNPLWLPWGFQKKTSRSFPVSPLFLEIHLIHFWGDAVRQRERGEERHQNSARGGGGGRENQTTDRRKKERDKRGSQENKIRQCFIASI